MSDTPLQTARALLEAMKAQAESGAMIPIRVPGEIDAILALLEQAADTAPPPAEPTPTQDPDATQPNAPTLSRDVLLAEERSATSEFISIGVHEMRIPLTSIRGYADMLGKGILGPLNDQQTQFVETIRSNTSRLDRLIADFNDYGKVKGNRLHLDIKMDTAKNVLMAAEKRVKDIAEQRSSPLTFDVPDGLPILNVDGGRVAQALGYLIENALVYSPEGSPVTVTARNEDNTLRVTVTDQGIGISEEDLPHLGEPFWRSEHEVIRSVKGHGLGYAVAKGIIENHGGSMIVDTVFEQGSTFGFTLPGLS